VAQKPALGKGLASLFPGANGPAPGAPAQASGGAVIGGELITTGAGAVAAGPAVPVQPQQDVVNKDRIPGISMVSLDDIVANTYQPRRDFDDAALEELAQSIRANGIIQPLVVRKRNQGNGWELIAGERRFRAARMAGLKYVPAVIRRSTDRESLELALIENIQRQDLNCIDEALAYQQLAEEFALTQEEIATRVGKDRATISNTVRLLKLPEAIIDDLKRQIMSFGHGKALLGVDDTEARLQIRAQVVSNRLSVRDTEALVEQWKQKLAGELPEGTEPTPPAKSSPVAVRLANLSQELTRHWSAKVEIKGSERRGKIILHYGTRQELERLLEAMKN